MILFNNVIYYLVYIYFLYKNLILSSYGFHKNHCLEALHHCKGEVDSALNLLFSKYFNIEPQNNEIDHGFTITDLLEQREDEKHVLQSIYDVAFEEKIANSVWIMTFNLQYLTNLYNKKPIIKKPTANINKKPLCRNIMKGIECKFGNKCRFSHDIPKEPKKNELEYLQPSIFELEIRFPKDSIYPFEPPILLLKTEAVLPEQLCLHICRRLLTEAQDLASQGMVSIYSVAELLNNEDEIVRFLKTNQEKFLSENEMLFPPDPKLSNSAKKILPSHYRKGLTNRDNKPVISNEEVIKEDQYLVKQFEKKKQDPKYIKSLENRRQLPAWGLMKEILNTIYASQVVVISGETGCGKSTQVPQFLLDDWLLNYNNQHMEIVCTQPRRISAIGVAERVADERIEKVGKSVGYQIRLESKVSNSTRLTFCTTGILLRRLESDPKLNAVSHIIVDEVHERSEESDFLLLILKDLLPLRPDLKVILMSATMNAQVFCDYFGKVPILEIPGRTFPVEQLFLEDVLETTAFVMEENSQYTRKVKKMGDNIFEEFETSEVLSANAKPKDVIRDENLTIAQLLARYEGTAICFLNQISYNMFKVNVHFLLSHSSLKIMFSGYNRQTCKNLYLMDHEKTNLDIIEHLLTWIVSGNHSYPREGSILVFLPGIAEITSLHEQLNDHSEFSPRYGKYVLLPLHSTLTSEEQAAIFK